MKAKVILAVVLVVLAIEGAAARADFTLTGTQHLNVVSYHSDGTLKDASTADVWPYGFVYSLNAYDTSSVNISSGYAGFDPSRDASGVGYLIAWNNSIVNISSGYVSVLSAYGSSTVALSGGGAGYIYAEDHGIVDISGGNIYSLDAKDSSRVDISGGSISVLRPVDGSSVDISGGTISGYMSASYGSSVDISGGTINDLYLHTVTVPVSGGSISSLYAYDTSTVDISAGAVNKLYASSSSTVTFDGQDFILGTGLSLDGDRVLGTGLLSGKWFDGTPWTVTISQNDAGATILAVPEPGTLSLLALLALSLPKRGGLSLLRRKSGYGG